MRKLSPDEIQATRKALNMSLTSMAQVFYVPNRTVEKWETGEVIPNRFHMAALYQLSTQAKQAEELNVKELYVKQLRRRAFEQEIHGLLELLFDYNGVRNLQYIPQYLR